MKQKYVNKNFDDIMNEVKKYMVKSRSGNNGFCSGNGYFITQCTQ